MKTSTARVSRAIAMLCCGAVFGGIGVAQAQETYPNRTIRLVIPFTPGGTTDTFARKFAAGMSRELGVTMVPDNKAGASGAIAASDVAHANPDGYSLFFGTSSQLAILPLMAQKTNYDIDKDFAPVALIGITSHLVAVNVNFPAKTLAELVAILKASPGKYSYGHSGVGGPTHLAGELLEKLTGVDILDVPYKGSAPALLDTFAGINPLFFDGFVTIIPPHRAGRLRALAVLADERSKIAPDIPTSAEAGVPGLVSGSFMVVMAPVKTPRNVLAVLENATAKVVRDPRFQKEMLDAYIEVVTDGTPAKAQQLIKRERAKWATVIKTTGNAPQ